MSTDGLVAALIEVDHELTPQQVEELRRRWKGDDIDAAIARAQQQMEHPKKTQKNPAFKSPKHPDGAPYADLTDVVDAVRPALNAEGIAVIQRVENGELVTEFRRGGEVRDSRLPLNLTGKPQDVGSQITYWRRFQLAALAGVSAEDDDDGNAASTARPRQQARSEPAAPPDGHLVEFNRLCAALGLDKAKDKAGFIATVTGTDAKWAQCSEETHVYIVGQLTAIASGELTLGFDNAGRPMAYPTGTEPFELDAPADSPADAPAEPPIAAAVEALAEARQATRGTKADG